MTLNIIYYYITLVYIIFLYNFKWVSYKGIDLEIEKACGNLRTEGVPVKI
jgi:hypothetical protein